jgi:hypothetical protein
MEQATLHIPLRLSSSPRNKMSSPLASNEDLAHSQKPSALPPLTTESPDMAGPTQETEEPREEQVEVEQEYTPQPEPPVVEQATSHSTPEAEDSPEAHTADTASTTATSSDLPDMATPMSSISPGLESTPDEVGSKRPKRTHEAMAGPSPYVSNKFVKLGDLSDEQVVAQFLAASSRGGQVSETSKTTYLAPVGTDEDDEEEEEEEMPTRKRTVRKTGVIAETHIASVEPEEEEEEEEELPTDKRVARNAFDPTTLPSSSFDFIASARSDEEDEEEMPTKRKGARKAGVKNESSHIAFFGSDGEGEEEPPRKKGVARRVGPTEVALYSAWLSRSSSSVLETNKRSRAASVGSDEEDDEEPPTKKRSTRKVGVTKDGSPANLSEDPVVLEPTTFSNSCFDFETPGSTIYSKETSDPRKRSPQPPLESDPVTATTPSQPPTKSYLHLLPGELRNRIYTHLGLRSSRVNLDTLEMPSLMIAYPDFKSEMLSIMLSDNRLRVPVYSDFRIKASEAASHPKLPSSVGDFKVGTVAIDPKSWVMDIDPHFVTIKHIGLRILEVPNPHRDKDVKLICDYFLNVRVVKGKRTAVSHKISMMASTATQRQSRAMCDLATARAKRFAEQDGFAGFTWKQVHEIAASFESVIEAQSHFTKVKGKVFLN